MRITDSFHNKGKNINYITEYYLQSEPKLTVKKPSELL